MLVVLARQRKANWRAEEEASVSVEENNKALVRRFNEEVYNRGNMDVADELLAPNFVSREALTGEEASREDLKREIAEQAATSSDLHFSIEEQIAEGDKVVPSIVVYYSPDTTLARRVSYSLAGCALDEAPDRGVVHLSVHSGIPFSPTPRTETRDPDLGVLAAGAAVVRSPSDE